MVDVFKIFICLQRLFEYYCFACVKVQVLLSYVTTMNIVTIVTILTFLSQQTQEIITTTIIQLQPANTLE